MSLTFYPRDFKMSTSRDEYDGNFCRSVGHRILCGVLDTLDEHFILAYKSNELHYLYNQVKDDWGRPWLLDGNTPPAWITYWLVKLKVKEEWMEKTELICKEVRNKVSDKSWIKVKPKTNPRPMEFPQDVFNVVKDYLGVYDIPEPITELMDMMKITNLGDGCIDTSMVSIVSIKDRKSLGVDGRLSLFKSKVVWDTKNPEYPDYEKNEFLLKIAKKYPQLNFGKELTDNNKIFLMDLLFTNNYEGTEDQGLKTEASLFDFMRGECGLSKFKKTPKKPRPYVMYFERDYYGEEYAVKNFACDMRDFYNSMDNQDFKTIRYACNHLLS